MLTFLAGAEVDPDDFRERFGRAAVADVREDMPRASLRNALAQISSALGYGGRAGNCR